MSNAAEYLLQFFEVEQQPDGFRKDVLSAYTAMCSTERTLDTLIARGVKRLDMAKSQMPGIWKALWESFSEDANGFGVLLIVVCPSEWLMVVSLTSSR